MMPETPSSPIPLSLLDRYLADECTSADADAVDAWLDADSRHRELLWSMRTLRPLRGGISPDRVDAVWILFSQQAMAGSSDALSHAHYGDTMRDTAGPAGAISVAGRIPQGRLTLLPTSSRPPRPAPITHALSRQLRGNRIAAWAIALVAVIVSFAGWRMYASRTTSRTASFAASSPGAMRTYATGRGQRVTVQLADGSRVSLGPESEMRVPANFLNAKVRDVQLTGSAYFEVTHDPASAFIVRSGDAVVRVIGTAFSVVHYQADTAVRVVVTQGKVDVRRTDDGSLRTPATVVAAGGVAWLGSDDSVHVRHDIDLAEATAWTRGELVFRRMPLADVARALERWYDVDIEIPDRALATQRITASFARESVTDVVAQLADAANARYRVDGRRVVIQRR